MNSLRSKFNELKTILSMNYLDIFILAETKIDDSFHDFNMVNYRLIRQDRNANAGGLCIFLRNHLACIRLEHIY